jgi:hypothetical protein
VKYNSPDFADRVISKLSPTEHAAYLALLRSPPPMFIPTIFHMIGDAGSEEKRTNVVSTVLYFLEHFRGLAERDYKAAATTEAKAKMQTILKTFDGYITEVLPLRDMIEDFNEAFRPEEPPPPKPTTCPPPRPANSLIEMYKASIAQKETALIDPKEAALRSIEAIKQIEDPTLRKAMIQQHLALHVSPAKKASFWVVGIVIALLLGGLIHLAAK